MKRKVYLKESDLHKIVKNAVVNVLKENYSNGFGIMSSKRDRDSEAGGYCITVCGGIQFHKDKNNNKFWDVKCYSQSINRKYPTIPKGIEAMKQTAKKLNARNKNDVIILTEWETGYLVAYYSAADSGRIHIINNDEIIRYVSDLKQNQNETINRITESKGFDAKQAARSDMMSDNDKVDDYNKTAKAHNRKADAVNTGINNPEHFDSEREWQDYVQGSYKAFDNDARRYDDRADAMKRILKGKRMNRKDIKDRPWDLSSFGSGNFNRSMANDIEMLDNWNDFY